MRCTIPAYDAGMTDGIAWIGLDGPAPCADRHGEKAALLGAAAGAGLPVPPGFVLPPEFDGDLAEPLQRLEAATGTRLGDTASPLLLAVRPSASIGAGGVAPAVLDIGVTRSTLPGLASLYGPRVAQDLYRRLIHSWGAGAQGVEGEEFEYALHDALRYSGAKSETELTSEQLAELAQSCLQLIEDETGAPFPQDATA